MDAKNKKAPKATGGSNAESADKRTRTPGSDHLENLARIQQNLEDREQELKADSSTLNAGLLSLLNELISHMDAAAASASVGLTMTQKEVSQITGWLTDDTFDGSPIVTEKILAYLADILPGTSPGLTRTQMEKDIRIAAEGHGPDNDLEIALSEAIKRTDHLVHLLRDLYGRKGVIKTGLAKSLLNIEELVELQKKLKTGDDPADVEITANNAELLKRQQHMLGQLADIKVQMDNHAGEYRRPAAPSPSTAITAPSNGWLDRFKTVTFEEGSQPFSKISPRSYQKKAVSQILTAVAQDQRRILLTMPNESGKSLIASQLVWTLFHAKWNMREQASRHPRILFLSGDALDAEQRYIKSFGVPDESVTRITLRDIQKTNSVPTHGSVFYADVDTLTKLDADDLGTNRAWYLEYQSDFFDLIVIDPLPLMRYEVLDYFSSSVQIGLTARLDEDLKTHFGDPVYDGSDIQVASGWWVETEPQWKLTDKQPRPMTNAVAHVLRDGRPRSVFEIAKEGWSITGGQDSRSYMLLRPKITKALRRAYRENNDIEQPRRGVYSSRHYEDPNDAINDAFDRGWIVDVRPFHVTVNNISIGHKPPEPSLYVPDEFRPDWDHWCRANTEWITDCENFKKSGLQYDWAPIWRRHRMNSATLFDKFELCLRLSPNQGTVGFKRGVRVWQFSDLYYRGMKRRTAEDGPPWTEKGIENVLSWLVLNVAATAAEGDLNKTTEGGVLGSFGFSKSEMVTLIAEKLQNNLWASYGLDLNSIRIIPRHDPSHWNEVSYRDEEAKIYTLDHDRESHLLSGDLTKTLSDISRQALSVQPEFGVRPRPGHLINEKQKNLLNESFVVDPVAVPIIAVDLGLIYKNGSKFEFSNEGKSSEQRDLWLYSLRNLRKNEREVETRNDPWVLETEAHDLLKKHPELNDEILSIIKLYAAKARTRPVSDPKKSIRIPRTGIGANPLTPPHGYRSRFPRNKY